MVYFLVKTEKPLSFLSSLKLNCYCSSKSFCCYPKYKTQKWCTFAVIAILHSLQLAIGLDMHIISTRINLVYQLTSVHYANLLREKSRISSSTCGPNTRDSPTAAAVVILGLMTLTCMLSI